MPDETVCICGHERALDMGKWEVCDACYCLQWRRLLAGAPPVREKE